MYHFAEFSYDTLTVNIYTVSVVTSVKISSRNFEKFLLSVKFSSL